MKLFYVLILCLLISVPSLFAQDFTETDMKIMDLIYNAQWQKADSIIESQIKQNQDHPKYYFMKAPLYFYTRYFTGGALPGDSLWQLVADYSQKAIDVAESKEETTEIKFYLGCAYGFLSRYQIRHGQTWDGYWSADESEDYLEDVLDENPNFHDAQLGLAVLDYYPAVGLSGFYRTLAWFLGASGDREDGLEGFRTVQKKGKLFKNEATFILALLNRYYENDFDKAIKYNAHLREKFPQNNFFRTQYLQTRLVQVIDEKGVEFLENGIDTLRAAYEINNANVLNGMGYNYIGQNRFDEAEKIFQLNIKLYPEVANCYDSMAECYMLSDDNENAIKYYKIAYAKLETDSTANEEFKERLRTGIEERLEELGAPLNI